MGRTRRDGSRGRGGLALAAVLMVLLPHAGCPTAGEAERVLWMLWPRSLQGAEFTTALGYDVELTQGAVSMGRVHFHAPADEVAARGRAAAARLAGRLFALGSPLLAPGSARAHPGHDMAGDIGGETDRPFVVDLLGGVEDGLDGALYEGRYATVSLALQPEAGTALLGPDHPINGHTLALVGTADEGGGPIPFELIVDHSEEVAGVPFEHEIADLDADGNTRFHDIYLYVDAAAILAHLDFAALDEDGDGVVTVDDPAVGNSLIFGLESTAAYSLELTVD